MNPVSWTKQKRGFYMGKLTYEDKINLYNDRKRGMTVKSLVIKYGVRHEIIEYLISLIDKHGFGILRTNKNKQYLLSYGMLQNWIKKYKDMDYNIVEQKRGRRPTMKVTKKKENETDKEKIKRLEEENLYLKAELEYSKKLRAVVQARKNQQQKKE